MKIIAFDNAHRKSEGIEPSVFLYPDSCILRNNEPFFVPDVSHTFTVIAGLILKISKIGKCIEPEFAQRYVSHVGLAINFRDITEEKLLKDIGSNHSMAWCKDRSLAASNEMFEIDIMHKPSFHFIFKVNDDEFKGTTQTFRFSVDSLVSYASTFMTLKIGDLLFIPAFSFEKGIQVGDVFAGFMGDKYLLKCQMK